MRGVAEVYNLIINAATRFNMKGISLPRIVVVGTEVKFILTQLNATSDLGLFNLATAPQLRWKSPKSAQLSNLQSTGKTSLINRIVNKDFLPSGTGIVTRMPIKIGLVRTPLDDPQRKKSSNLFTQQSRKWKLPHFRSQTW